MDKRSINGEKRFIWLQMLGLEKNDPDKGVARYLEQTGFIPEGICALVFHPDIVNQHRGMDEEYVLPPDNCAYYGVPRNVERERQEWTNYDLRTFCKNMKSKGTGVYMSIFGAYMWDTYHHEWLTDHPEIRYISRDDLHTLHCLKRFKDGTYYEDFFIDKLVEVLQDYNFEGVHITDAFCPLTNTRYDGDFSTDMVEQFINHAGITLPDDIAKDFGNDDFDAINRRGDWIWKEHRADWLRFHDWRWGVFYKKLCDRVHAIGKKVIVLGMYCTDPFESMYLMGFSLKTIFDAGVDAVMPNIVPTGIYMESLLPSFFHRYMSIIPLAKAQVPDGEFLCLLGVQDASEEWDTIRHAPCKAERDAYTMFSYQFCDKNGLRRAMDGLMICLGDGMQRSEWEWLNDRLDIAFDMTAKELITPVVVWSDTANERQLDEYIKTRRSSVHRQMHKITELGVHFGGSVRSEEIAYCNNTLFIPNFDLLSDTEKRDVAKYKGGAVVCTAGPDYTPDDLDVKFLYEDRYAEYPLKVFVLNTESDAELEKEIEEIMSIPDNSKDLDMDNITEHRLMLQDDIPFRKVSECFLRVCALILKKMDNSIFKSNVPYRAYKIGDNKYRLYLYGIHEDRYSHALVECSTDIENVEIISKYPVLPVKFVEDMDTRFGFGYNNSAKRKFQLKLQPGGSSIVDVTTK